VTGLLRLGDDVRLEDGREGQVWIEPAPDAYKVVVALGNVFETVRLSDLQVVGSQLPGPPSSQHAARLIRARIDHKCAKCEAVVPAGKSYVRSVIFPGHQSGAAGERGKPGSRPIHQDLCVLCATKFPDTHPTNLQQKEAS
jgi:hypothetical protein